MKTATLVGALLLPTALGAPPSNIIPSSSIQSRLAAHHHKAKIISPSHDRLQPSPKAFSITSPITVNAEYGGYARVCYGPYLSGDFTDLTCDHTPCSLFPKDSTTVTCTDTDASSYAFEVKVVDTEVPLTLFDLSSFTINSISERTDGWLDVSFNVSILVTDNVDSPEDIYVECDPTGAVTNPADSQTYVFKVDPTSSEGTEIYCWGVDKSGNDDSQWFADVFFKIPSVDGPVLITPYSTNNKFITSEDEDPTPIIDYTALGFDRNGTALDVVCDHPSGSAFPAGYNDVTCRTTDSDNTTVSNSFQIRIKDQVSPTISINASSFSLVSIDAADGAVISFDPIIEDNAYPNSNGEITVTCNMGSGSGFTFAIGQTQTVTCYAQHDYASTASTSFVITVPSASGPIMIYPNAVTKEATGELTTVTLSPIALDASNNLLNATCNHHSGSGFTLGTTSVTCTATDEDDNSVTGTFSVTVQDTTKPTLVTSEKYIKVPSEGKSGATTVTYDLPEAADNYDSDLVVDCYPPSGSEFAYKVTEVVCQTTDSNGLSAELSLIYDPEPPVMTWGDFTLESLDSKAAIMSYTVTATDAYEGPVDVDCHNGIALEWSEDLIAQSDHSFDVGNMSVVTCNATDISGNTVEEVRLVTVTSKTAPVIVSQAFVVALADGPLTAVSYTLPYALDEVDGRLDDVECSPASGEEFPPGMTEVSCSVNNTRSSIGTSVFLVFVVDSDPPVIDGPVDTVVVEATGVQTSLTWEITATDAAYGDIAVVCDPLLGSLADIDSILTVTCTATDGQDNTASYSFEVNVQDNTEPTITAPDITMEATTVSDNVVDYDDLVAIDLVDGDVGVTCDPPTGSTFEIGETTVSCSCTDSHDNPATASFVVNIVDHPPVITLPADQVTKEATGAKTTVFYTNATAMDVVDDGNTTVVCLPVSGTQFSVGKTLVTCTTTDSNDNTATKSFNVTVTDKTAPTLTNVPTSFDTEATGTTTAITYTLPTAADLVDGTTTVTCTPSSGSLRALGAHTVSCTSTDNAKNTVTQTFTVTIKDTTAPSLTVPSNSTMEATASLTTISYTTPNATDLVDGMSASTCSPASGSQRSVGKTKVTCTKTDSHSNTVAKSFWIDVKDTTAPTITAPNITLEATGDQSAVDYDDTSVSDLVDGSGLALTCSPSSGSSFGVGHTKVTCSATDAHSNTGTKAFWVKVEDTTPPTVDVPKDIHRTVSTDDGLVEIDFDVWATDLVDGSIGVVDCDHDSGANYSVGSVNVTCTATDAEGNQGSASFSIEVTVDPTVGYAFVDFTVGMTVPGTIDNNDMTLAKTSAIVRPAIAELLGVDKNTLTITAVTISEGTKEEGILLSRRRNLFRHHHRRLTGSSLNVYADTTATIPVLESNMDASGGSSLLDAAQAVVEAIKATLTSSQAELTELIQSEAANAGDSTFGSVAVNDSLSSTSSDFSYGNTNDPALATLYTPSSDNKDKGGIPVIGVAAGAGAAVVLAIGGLGMFIHHKRKQSVAVSG